MDDGRTYYTDKDEFAKVVLDIISREAVKRGFDHTWVNTIEFGNDGARAYCVKYEVICRTGYNKNGYYILDSMSDMKKL